MSNKICCGDCVRYSNLCEFGDMPCAEEWDVLPSWASGVEHVVGKYDLVRQEWMRFPSKVNKNNDCSYHKKWYEFWKPRVAVLFSEEYKKAIGAGKRILIRRMNNGA